MHSLFGCANEFEMAFMLYYCSEWSLKWSGAGFSVVSFCQYFVLFDAVPDSYQLLDIPLSKTFINFIYFTHDLWHLNESKPVASLHAYLIYSSRATKLTVFRSRCERTLKLHLQRNVCLLFISCTRTSPNDFRLSVSF